MPATISRELIEFVEQKGVKYRPKLLLTDLEIDIAGAMEEEYCLTVPTEIRLNGTLGRLLQFVERERSSG